MTLSNSISRATFLLVFVFLCPTLTLSQELDLKLVWRQEFQQKPLTSAPIFSKPSFIDPDFVTREVIQGNQLFAFDGQGRPSQQIPIGPESELSTSPAGVATVLSQPQLTGVSEEADEVPTQLTGFISGTQAWNRFSSSGVRAIVADSGTSALLNLYTCELQFYDSNGNLLQAVIPFGTPLPWAFDRPSFGAFSGDGSTFALLATGSDFQSVSLFVYDSEGNIRSSQTIPQFQIAAGLGTSLDGSSFLIAGWVAGIKPGVGAILFDKQFNLLQKFEVPAIGERVTVSPDPSNGDFVLDNGAGTIVRVGSVSAPVSFDLGTRISPSSTATNAGLTAVLALRTPKEKTHDEDGDSELDRYSPRWSDAEHLFLHLRILDATGRLLLSRRLHGDTRDLDQPSVRISRDGNFISVQFSDEIRYYELKRKDRDE